MAIAALSNPTPKQSLENSAHFHQKRDIPTLARLRSPGWGLKLGRAGGEEADARLSRRSMREVTYSGSACRGTVSKIFHAALARRQPGKLDANFPGSFSLQIPGVAGGGSAAPVLASSLLSRAGCGRPLRLLLLSFLLREIGRSADFASPPPRLEKEGSAGLGGWGKREGGQRKRPAGGKGEPGPPSAPGSRRSTGWPRRA